MENLNFKKTKWKFFTLFAVFSFAMTCQQAFSQIQPNGLVFKNWQMLGESSMHIDVSYSIGKCADVNLVYLKISNESSNDQDLHFQVDIMNTENGEHFSKDLNVSLIKLTEIKGQCTGGNDLADLKIELPSSYNPMKTTAMINFKN